MNTVVIVEDNEVLLESFTQIIDQIRDFEVMGSFTNCEDALSSINNLQPDVVLMDIQLPGMNGIEGIKRLYFQWPAIKTLVISVHEESSYIFDALSAGAIGYLTKNSTPEELQNALDQVMAGGSPMSSTIARKVVSYFQTPKQEALSERENEVLQVLAKGKSYAAIANELNLSINTIKTHTRNIYEKLHVNSREEIIEKFQKR